MKNILFVLFCSLFYVSLVAQVDTVLYEGFQFDNFDDMVSSPSGTDVDWVNYDEDGVTTNTGTNETKQWYYGEALINEFDSLTGITNYVAISLSFLENSVPGNRNWLVLPPVKIEDDSYMLHWESAPNQMPRYMDGYHVLLSTSGNKVEDFTEVLFEAASMDVIVGEGQSVDYTNFEFTSGYKHADCATKPEYFVEGTTIHYGVLEPHSIDLSAYEGEEVYIAFLHNSDDDDRISIDDVLITKAAAPSDTEDISESLRIECYPNPVTEILNISYTTSSSVASYFNIYGQDGSLIQTYQLGHTSIGKNIHAQSLSDLPRGSFQLELVIGDSKYNQQILKL